MAIADKGSAQEEAGSAESAAGITTETTAKASECDLVLAGGITSGVVYPKALERIAKKYRFRNIGGTSVGAIAAAAVAAAEFGRLTGNQNDGFGLISDKFASLNGNLLPLFQPQKGLDRLFSFALKFLEARKANSKLATIAAMIRAAAAYWKALVFGLLIYLLVNWGFFHSWGSPPALASGHLSLSLCFQMALFAVVGLAELLLYLAAALAAGLIRDVLSLAKANFGLCTGTAQDATNAPALMEWVHDLIQAAAGRKPGGDPLTFGDLKEKDIYLRMMTTSLSLGIGYALPSLGKTMHYYDPEDLGKILPAEVADWIGKKPAETITHNGKTLRALPVGDAMPVILAARMSLSFPVLFTAVPLYRTEKSVAKVTRAKSAQRPTGASRVKNLLPERLRKILRLENGGADKTVNREHVPDGSAVDHIEQTETIANQADDTTRRVWFSDGGITSNFPVRFFDALVPSRPTFGISLEDREDEGLPGETVPAAPDVFLPMQKGSDRTYEIKSITTLSGFFAAIVNTAREWQDRKQSRMDGWRERVARVYLRKDEGGLNLGMDPALIDQLAARGERAAGLLLDEKPNPDFNDEFAFDFTEHQWRRFLVAHSVVADALFDFEKKWASGLKQLLEDNAKRHGGNSRDYPMEKNDANRLMEDMSALAGLAKQFRANSKLGERPAIAARLEIVPHDQIQSAERGAAHQS